MFLISIGAARLLRDTMSYSLVRVCMQKHPRRQNRAMKITGFPTAGVRHYSMTPR